MLDVPLFDHRFFCHAAEHRQLPAQVEIERALGAANQHLRLQTDLAQLSDTLLSRFRFHFARRFDVRHERDVHIQHILRAGFEDELPDSFEKRQPLDIPSRATNFSDDDVIFAFVRNFPDALFDHVGDVRNYLHGFP